MPTSLEAVHNPFIVDEGVIPDEPQTTTTTTEETPPPVESTPPPAEPETVVETPPSAETTAEGTKVRQPSRKDLSTQLEVATAELEKLRSDGAVYDQKYKDAVAKQAELEEKLKTRDEEYIKAKTPVYRWQDDPEVAKPRQEIAEIVNDTAADLSPETAKVFKKDFGLILQAYGDARTKGEEALRTLRSKLTEHFGEEGPAVWAAVRGVHPKYAASVEAEKKNSENHFTRSVQDYHVRSRQLREEFLQIGRMTPEQIAANPDDPNAIISSAVAGDENLIKEIEKNALKAAQATAGLPPLPLDATPEQVEAYRAAERNLHNFKEKMAFRKEVESRVLSSIVRKLVAENEALKKRVSGAADANRPESSTTSAPPTPKKVNYSGNYEDAPNPHLTGR